MKWLQARHCICIVQHTHLLSNGQFGLKSPQSCQFKPFHVVKLVVNLKPLLGQWRWNLIPGYFLFNITIIRKTSLLPGLNFLVPFFEVQSPYIVLKNSYWNFHRYIWRTTPDSGKRNINSCHTRPKCGWGLTAGVMESSRDLKMIKSFLTSYKLKKESMNAILIQIFNWFFVKWICHINKLKLYLDVPYGFLLWWRTLH